MIRNHGGLLQRERKIILVMSYWQLLEKSIISLSLRWFYAG